MSPVLRHLVAPIRHDHRGTRLTNHGKKIIVATNTIAAIGVTARKTRLK
jgi:hypothetical protein